MKRHYPRLVALALPIIAACLSACNFFAPQDAPLDLLDSDPASTQIAALRATATVEMDRMMVTLDAVNTAVRAVDVQSTRIAATLIARGTPFVDISMLTPFAPTSAAFQPNNGGAQQSFDPNAVSPLVTPGGGAQGNANFTPIAPSPNVVGTPTPLPGTGGDVINTGGENTTANTSALLSNIALTRAGGADDCPTGTLTQFSTGDTDIYVTAVANVPQGSQIRAEFFREGTQIVAYDWSPTFDVNGACIWFHMPSSAVAYDAGAWSVTLSVNGTSMGSVDFSIQ